MRKISAAALASGALAGAIALTPFVVNAQTGPAAGPNKIIKTMKAGDDGGFDYIFADSQGRRLYVPRNGATGKLYVFDLDTLDPVGEIDGIHSGGATVDPKSHHGFSTTKPLTMWDSDTLKIIKTIDVDGRPDGILFDPYAERVWVLSHQPPYATIIDAKDGTVAGTLDVGGGPEEGVSDGKGTIYINVSDKANIAVIDAKTLQVKAHYDVSSKGMGGSGLALDAKNGILFAYYRMPNPVVVIVNAKTGKILDTLPTGAGVDTVAFNPLTMEAVSGENGGTMTFIKEESPAKFKVEQTVTTIPGAKTVAFDAKTGHVITMSAEFEPAKPGAPNGPAGRPARGPMIPGSFELIMVGR